jgi:hypothetical protein
VRMMSTPLVQVVMKSYPNWLDFELACGYPFHDVNRIVGRDCYGTGPQVFSTHCPVS